MDYKTRKQLNSVEKIYWYLRYFVETDKGAVAKKKQQIISLAETLGAVFSSVQSEDEGTIVTVMNKTVSDVLLANYKSGTKQFDKVDELVSELAQLTLSPDDFYSLIFCLNHILIPSSEALDRVPTTEATQIASLYAKNLLATKGTAGLSNIFLEWDSITLDICLNRERDICSQLFKTVRTKLETDRPFNETSSIEKPNNTDIILSSVIQEFERRLGQKRKQRSGQDLESATGFIFEYFNIAAADKPKHFTAAIEVDNWIKDKKGWYIGFSLKRTLRERWKQTVVDKDTLTEFKIRYIVHLICNDGDLTESKIADMGAKRHLFFVPDSSDVLTRVSSDNVLIDYVKPMSELISFIKSS